MEELEEILEPIEIEVEKYTEDDYCDMLDEVYGDCMCCGYSMQSSFVLREMDNIAYRTGFNDWQEYETKYECPICAEVHGDYESAKWCCQVEPEESEEDE
jgi:hypothetical protein